MLLDSLDLTAFAFLVVVPEERVADEPAERVGAPTLRLVLLFERGADAPVLRVADDSERRVAEDSELRVALEPVLCLSWLRYDEEPEDLVEDEPEDLVAEE